MFNINNYANIKEMIICPKVMSNNLEIHRCFQSSVSHRDHKSLHYVTERRETMRNSI